LFLDGKEPICLSITKDTKPEIKISAPFSINTEKSYNNISLDLSYMSTITERMTITERVIDNQSDTSTSLIKTTGKRFLGADYTDSDDF
jgi:hypothetical protein